MALFNRVTVWVSNQVLTAAALNGEFNNILNNAQISSWVGYSATVPQMQALFIPGGIGSENKPSSGADEVAALRYMVKFLSGGTQWYDQTGRTLAAGSLAIQTADIAAGAVTQVKRAPLGQVTSGTSGPFLLTSGSATAHTIKPAAETCTITIATPGVITIGNTQNITLNDPVVFTTSGALPTGITAGTTYYVQQINSATQFQISATVGGAAITTSGSQSGVQTITYQGLSVTITTTGRMVMLAIVDDMSGSTTAGTVNINSGLGVTSGIYAGATVSALASGAALQASLQVLRGATVIASPQLGGYNGVPNEGSITPPTGITAGTNYFVATASSGSPNHQITWSATSYQPGWISWPLSSIFLFDAPVAGTYTYSVKLFDQGANASIALNYGRLVAVEL